MYSHYNLLVEDFRGANFRYLLYFMNMIKTIENTVKKALVVGETEIGLPQLARICTGKKVQHQEQNTYVMLAMLYSPHSLENGLPFD